MTKILCVGDIHATEKPPANCTETYLDDLIEMLGWTAEFARTNEVDAVVWAGDVFHHKSPGKTPHSLVLKMIEVVRAYEGRLWIVAGNHDLSNDVLDTLRVKQPLGVLLAAGAHELRGWHPSLPLYGVPWQQDWTTDTAAALDRSFAGWRGDGEEPVPAFDASKCLVVTHAPVYPPEQVERGVPFDLVPTAALAEAMGGAGSLYYGHIHEDHGIYEVGGVTFANVGAISRGSLHEYNLAREVKVALWSEAGFTQIPVPHRPASEVFRLERAQESKDARLDLEDFLVRAGSATLDITSTSSVIAHLRSRDDLDPLVRERAVMLLEAADA